MLPSTCFKIVWALAPPGGRLRGPLARNFVARALPRSGVGGGRGPETSARASLLRVGRKSHGGHGPARYSLPRVRDCVQAHLEVRGPRRLRGKQ